jgi:hypothetical protein
MKRILVICFIAAAGCTTAPESAPPAPTQGSLEVRLLGANPGSLYAVYAEVKELEVTAAGKPVRSYLGQHDINLANVDHAWLLGTFSPPTDAQSVHIKVVLDDYGAWETLTGSAGYLDARNTAIEFDAPVRWLAERGHATVKLDLSRSLVKRADEVRRLHPQVQIAY